jgi:hypothetical protein
MTTYAYPITLYEYLFNDLEAHLKRLCEQWEAEGQLVYDPETRRPISGFANVLEIMKEAKATTPRDADGSAFRITFTLMDYLFIPLENLLKEECRQYKEKSGNNPFDSLTGEPQCSYASILEAMRLAMKNMMLNSYSSFVDSAPIKLWSPKKSA